MSVAATTSGSRSRKAAARRSRAGMRLSIDTPRGPRSCLAQPQVAIKPAGARAGQGLPARAATPRATCIVPARGRRQGRPTTPARRDCCAASPAPGRRPDADRALPLLTPPDAMSHNTFGHLFRVTTWGESHGPALGCVVDGCPPGHPADRGRHPALAGPAQARRQPLRHPAAGAGRGADPVRRVRGRAHRRPGDHRHADLADDRERRPARSKDYGEIAPPSGPATPTTPTSPSTACATIAAAAGPRRARPRRGSRPARWRARCWATASPSAPPWSRSGRTRSTATRWDLGRDATTIPFWCPGPGRSCRSGRSYLDERPQGRLVHRRHRRGGGRRACPPAGARRSTASSTPNWPAP